MGFYVENVIAISVPVEFYKHEDRLAYGKKRILELIAKMPSYDAPPIDADNIDFCLSHNSASKGDLFIIAGTFNYWGMDQAVELGEWLSAHLKTQVMVMSRDETEAVCFQVFQDGFTREETQKRYARETNEHTLSSMEHEYGSLPNAFDDNKPMYLAKPDKIVKEQHE